jgi:hypothetical protein
MANPQRGEIAAVIDGRPVTLRLTLGALAELEEAMGAEGLADMADRIEAGRLRARDVVAVLAAGLRGAGHDDLAAQAGELAFAEGAAGAAAAALRLLTAAFTGVATPGAPS